MNLDDQQLVTTEPDIRIEAIMFFDMRKPEMVKADWIDLEELKFGHTTRINSEVMAELTAKGYKLVSTEKQGTIVYGIFQKI